MDRMRFTPNAESPSLEVLQQPAGVSDVMHEVTVKILGLKSLVHGLTPSIRVVVALLRDNVASSQTSMSTKFGSLNDEDTMSMAVWEEKDTSDATLVFDSELKVSSRGTFSKECTELIVGLVDTSVNEPALLCTPVGIATLRIKAFGETNRTTQLLPVRELQVGRHTIPPFRVGNGYYNSTTKPFLRSSEQSHSEQKKKSPRRFLSRNKLGFKASSFRKKAQQKGVESYMREEEIIPPISKRVNASLDSALLLLDLTWKNKDTALDSILDESKLSKMASLSLEKSRLTSQEVMLSEAESIEACSSLISSTRHSVTLNRTRSGQISMSAMTEATRHASNTAKSRQNTPIDKNTVPATKMQQPLDRTKRFWVVPLKMFRRGFISKDVTPGGSTAERADSESVPRTVSVKEKQTTSSVCESTLTERMPILDTSDPFCDGGASGKSCQAPERLFLLENEPSIDRPKSPFDYTLEEKLEDPRHEKAEDCTDEVSVDECSLPRELFYDDDNTLGNSTITMAKLKPKQGVKKPEADNKMILFNILPECSIFDGDPSQFPVLEGYDNLLDGDEETVATLETIDTYLREKRRVELDVNTFSNFWNDDTFRDISDELVSLGGFESHEGTDFLRAHIPGFSDDDVTFVPEPEEVIWTELYKGCGVKSVERLTDGFVLLPERLFGNFTKERCAFEYVPDSPTMVSSTDSEMNSQIESGIIDDEEIEEYETPQPSVRITVSSAR